ncbi:MAG: DNA-binding protein WhiA [Clostridia bacterium]|nr:DNA-binding protein WhiA [Clostridia bacterium]
MSFAAETKNALCEIRIKKPCCKKALLLGILRAAYLFCGREIRFTTRSHATACLTGTLLWEVYGIRTALASADDFDAAPADTLPDGETEGESYQIILRDDDARCIADEFPQSSIPHPASVDRPAALPEGVFSCPACHTAFLRGVFLSCGNVTDPATYYHLDMVLSEDDMAEEFGYFLEENGLAPKHTARKGMPVLYYKESEAIEDFLTVIGAKKAAFAIMDAKILKDIRNNANRVSNCELANLGKTVDAATVQYEAICTLMEEDRFRLLPVELQQTARLRYEHPDLPLKDLAALHDPPMTKSGLNHRLKRIVDFGKKEDGQGT